MIHITFHLFTLTSALVVLGMFFHHALRGEDEE